MKFNLSSRLLLVALASVTALALTSCASDVADASPTDSVVAAASASPSAAATSIESEEPSETSVPQPSGDLAFNIGFAGSVGFKQLPVALTADRLNEAGWEIELVEFTEGSIATEALASGEIQVLSGVAYLVLLARLEGAGVSAVAEQNAVDFVMASTGDINSCEDMSGRRFGVHNTGGDLTNLVENWMAECGAEPDYLVIPGSENRVAAMLAGQLDATALDLSAWLELEATGDDYQLLAAFGEEFPDLSLAFVSVSDEWTQQNRDVATAFVAELLNTHRMIDEDPDVLLEAAESRLGGDPDVLAATVDAYLDLDAFPVNGGLTEDVIDGTIEFFENTGQLTPGLEASDVFDRALLDEALELVGAVPGRD